jgi:NADH-quinone oxidoreductase subunit D
MRILRQAVDRWTIGGVKSDPAGHKLPYRLTTKLPVGEVYLETECPRGQMGFYVVGHGGAEPLRTRAKSSSFCNLSVIGELCRGVLLADIPAIAGSLDIVMGEIDR